MEIGCKNKSADQIKRNNKTWSDTNFDYDFFKTTGDSFTRLICTCGNIHFEILSLEDSYETAAQCNKCKKYYLVHCG